MIVEEKRIFSIGEFAKLIGKSVSTLQKWDRKGILKAYRSPTGRRFYTLEQYNEYIEQAKRARNEV